MKSFRRKGARASKGMISIAVLVCLIVLLMMSGVVLRQGLARRELARLQARRLQAEWLAEAGLQRAVARLSSDRDYPGETWTIPAAELGRPSAMPTHSPGSPTAEDEHDAVVAIAIEPAKEAGNNTTRVVRVQADYPRNPLLRSRQSRRIAVEVESRSPTTGGAKP